VIEPTDEMVEAFRAVEGTGGWGRNDPREAVRAGLAAVLAIVARDRCMEASGHDDPLRHVEPSVEDWDWAPPKGWPSGRGGSHPHYCVSCSDGETQGPGCLNCRQTGMDQTPWPRCEGCRS
jgi:hypothetical protein